MSALTATPSHDGGSALSNMKNKGASWVVVSIAAASVAQLGLLVVLGRSLTPTEFGAAAGLVALGSLPRMVVEAMLPAPIIQRPTLSARTARTAATMSLGATLVLAAALWLGAGAISSLFAIDEMERWVRWLALVLPIHGLATAPQSFLQRDLRFKEASIIDAVAFLGGYLVGGGIAVAVGAGVGAVVVAMLAEGVVRVLLSMARYPVLPTLRPDTTELRQMGSFAASTGLGSTLNLLATRGDYVMISRLLGPVSLAAYTQAYQLAYNPGLILGRISNRWLFPVLARSQERPQEQADTFLLNLLGLGFVMGSAGVLTAALAPEAIGVLFGPGWDAAVRPLQILAIGLPFRVMYTLCDAHAKAVGQVGRRAAIQGVYAAAVVGLAALGATVSLQWAAAGVVAAVAVNYVLMLSLAISSSPITWAEVIRAHRLIPVGAAATAAALVLVVPGARSLDVADIVVVVVGIAAVAAALGVSYLAMAARRASVAPAVESIPAALPSTTHPLLDTSHVGLVDEAPGSAAAFDTLPLIAQLLHALHGAGVRAVVFKGTHRLERALSGQGDLDLLVAEAEVERAAEVLTATGLARTSSARWRTQPGVSDWFGVDRSAAALVHVQVAAPLQLGSPHGPQVCVSGSEHLLDGAVDVDGTPGLLVADRAHAAVVRLADAALAGRLSPGRSASELLADALRLAAGVPERDLADAASDLFDHEVAYAVATVAAGGSPRALRRALFRGHRASQRGRFAPGRFALSALAGLNRRTARKSFLPRRPTRKPAPMIAFIGSDGSGKSTVSRRMVEALDPKIDTRFYYFGTGDGPASLLRRPLVALKRLWERRNPKAETATPSPTTRDTTSVDAGSPPGGTRTTPAAARIVWAIVTTFERRAKLRRARRACRRGFVVISDRFPQTEEPGIHDGPRLADPSSLGRIGRAVAAWERRRYAAMVANGPDAVVLLDVSLEVAAQRRPEETCEELERRIAVARELRFGGAEKVVLDAHEPLEDVTARALSEVLRRVVA